MIRPSFYQCFGKFDFGSKNLAEETAKRMRRRDDLVVAYKCPKCRGWHVGEALGRTIRRRPAREMRA